MMVFITEEFFEVAIESWPEWDWNSRPVISFRRSNRMRYRLFSVTIDCGYCLRQSPRMF